VLTSSKLAEECCLLTAQLLVNINYHHGFSENEGVYQWLPHDGEEAGPGPIIYSVPRWSIVF
jgi:hypothetical protein